MNEYRNLLKKASQIKRMGIFRISITLLVGIFALVFGLIKLNETLLLISMLLFYISYQHYELFTFSNSLFKSLETLSGQIVQNPIEPEDKAGDN